jgi:hypothetical protein
MTPYNHVGMRKFVRNDHMGHPVRSLSAKNDPKPKTLRGRPAGRHVRLRRPDLIATATKSMDTFDLVSKERVNTLRPACRSCRQSSGC